MFILVYYLITGGLFYFLFTYLEEKRLKFNFRKLFKRVGHFNLAIGVIFLSYYYIKPSAFSPDVHISNQLAYAFMVAFSGYFYLIAPGISIRNIIVSIRRNIKYEVTILQLTINTIAVFSIALLTYNLFS
jgi:hypothetical protein